MASLFVKRGAYWLRFLDPEQNKWRSKPTGFKAPEGKRKAVELKMEISLAEARQKGPQVTPSEHGRWDGWVEDYLQLRYREEPKSLQRYQAHWRLLYRFLNEKGLRHPRSWRHEHNQDYYRWKLDQKKPSGKPYEPNSALGELKALAMLMNEAKRRGYISANPISVQGLPVAKVKRKEPLTDAEIAKIRKTLAEWKMNPPNDFQIDWGNMANVFEICLGTGCRMSETAIPFSYIDWKNRRITFGDPKGGEERAFTTPILGKAFFEWLQRLVDERQHNGASATADVPQHTSRDFGRFCDRIKLPHITLHCLRVTFVTRAYLAGVPEFAVKRLVNHSNDLVHEIYRRLSVDDLAQIAKGFHLPPPLALQPRETGASLKPNSARRARRSRKAASSPART